MLVQPLHRRDVAAVPALPTAPQWGVAVMLNANARQVGPRVIEALRHVVSPQDLFVSRSFLDLRTGVRQILDRGYHTVFCGGGDGTFMSFVNEVQRQRQSRPSRTMPRLGILRLGTGNSLASWVDASSAQGDRILDDVIRAQVGEVPGYKRLDLLSIDGKSAPFAGLGIDGRVLNDYVALKKQVSQSRWNKLLTGHRGYFSSVVTRTLPYCLTKPLWFDCEVKNGSAAGPAYRLGSDGAPIGDPVAPGELLFRGRLMMAAAATVPCYGFGLRMFPFAGMQPGMMQLRLAALKTSEVLLNLPKIWRGHWSHPRVHDFHARQVEIQFDRPLPLQIGGDAEGYRQELTIGMDSESVELADFNSALA